MLALRDVLGASGIEALLRIADLPAYESELPPNTLDKQFDFAAMAALSQALEETYGIRGGRGMALMIGRSAFTRGIQQFGVMKGLSHPAFQALPLAERLPLGLRALASVFTHFSDQVTTVVDEADHFLLEVETSPMAWGRVADAPVCHALVGITQECLRVASGGSIFHVREVACRAAGADCCVLRVNKQPVGVKNA